MNPTTWSELTSIATEIGLSGLADILAMSALLYLALSSLRGIRRVLQGAIVLVVAYVGARVFHLDLSASALEVTFVVVVLAAIVTFRDEVRQAIERIAVFYRFSGPRPSAELTLGHTLFQLAAERVGALVVVEGHDRIDELIHGGTALDGLPSDPLLKSLFDPHSAGHDGAVLLRDGRIVRVAGHLPLSTNFERLKGRGTRHAAALGLSERCDALAVVVSEERGVVSVAQAGTLSVINSPEELDAIVAGVSALSGRDTPDDHRQRRRLRTASAAFVMAALLWTVLVYGTRPALRSYEVAVDYADLPDELRVASVSPDKVRVTLTGARREFFFVDARSIRLSVPLASSHEGRVTYNLSGTDVATPAGLNVKSIHPSQVIVLVGKAP